MRGKAWQITRAGLFLLFAVLLAVLGPLSAEAGPQLRTGPAETKSETEHRDSEKLRERMPGIALHRRSVERREDRRPLLPRGLQGIARIENQTEVEALPNAGSKPHPTYAKLKHSPATLQVIRH
ncbi:hypothetical protein SAMN05216215_105313 [Saccharopolyspora shandongensis]|uniref:Uncharacterized protein n=1 Tax=Saccharopolyspora shandongensis TaxID=418495 RepID=A0A1H3RAC5_9PSEU|nr:hypothetical protein [Saccharopolyspora shandongensis]SDZ22782.1 hypothetical protein SAMN05216215_105313 [Saccharopolyspora shandongensis]